MLRKQPIMWVFLTVLVFVIGVVIIALDTSSFWGNSSSGVIELSEANIQFVLSDYYENIERFEEDVKISGQDKLDDMRVVARYLASQGIHRVDSEFNKVWSRLISEGFDSELACWRNDAGQDTNSISVSVQIRIPQPIVFYCQESDLELLFDVRLYRGGREVRQVMGVDFDRRNRHKKLYRAHAVTRVDDINGPIEELDLKADIVLYRYDGNTPVEILRDALVESQCTIED